MTRHVPPNGPVSTRARLIGITVAILAILGVASVAPGKTASAGSSDYPGVHKIAVSALDYADPYRSHGTLTADENAYVLDMTREDGNGYGCEFDYAGKPIPEAIPGEFDRLDRAARYDARRVSAKVKAARNRLAWYVGFCYLVVTESSDDPITRYAEYAHSDLGRAARMFSAIEVAAESQGTFLKKAAAAGAYFTDSYRFGKGSEISPPVAHGIADVTRENARKIGCPWDWQGFDLAGTAKRDELRALNDRKPLAWFEGYCFLDGRNYEGSPVVKAYARLGSAARVADAIKALS